MPVNPGTDTAAFLAMGHVALKEFYIDKQDPYFTEYARKYTDLPIQVMLRKHGDAYVSDRCLRASDFDGALGETNNPDWKTIVYDEKSKTFVAPNGSIGFRWGEEGKWNLLPKNAANQQEILAELTCIDSKDAVASVGFPHFEPGEGDLLYRNVPVRKVKLANGEEALVTSVFDMQVAQYGIDRGLGGGNVAKDYNDANVAYTPAWAEKVTGVKAADIERTGREFAYNASKTHGKSMVIMGAAINHWYHNDMMYRGVMNLLHICGCVGQSGGGWAHYVGQEKLRPQAGWAPIAFALDWQRPPRHMNSTSYWYFHTDQWRYETLEAMISPRPPAKASTRATRWPTTTSPPFAWAGCRPRRTGTPTRWIWFPKPRRPAPPTKRALPSTSIGKLKDGSLDVAFADPDNPENWPRNLFVWRANLIGTSAKGHEYFLKHLLGAQNGVLKEVRRWARQQAGQMARRSAYRQAGSDGRYQLPPEFHRRLFRHRSADRNLV